MTTALAPTAPPRWQLLYSPRAWRRWFAAKSARIRDAHSERAYDQLAPFVPAGARVVDVGAWDGRLGRLLRDRRGCDVTLVDVVDHNVTDLPFQVYDGRHLPLADQDRDRVIVMYVLHHAADDLAVLREARRVCRAGGRVLVAEDRVDTVGEKVRTIGFHAWLATFTFMGWTRFRKERAWRARFAEAGLRVEEVVPLGAVGALWPRNVLYVLAPA